MVELTSGWSKEIIEKFVVFRIIISMKNFQHIIESYRVKNFQHIVVNGYVVNV